MLLIRLREKALRVLSLNLPQGILIRPREQNTFRVERGRGREEGREERRENEKEREDR
jgi:hypothetical protein